LEEVNVKKKLSIVLAVMLMTTLLLTDVIPVSGDTNPLDMSYYCLTEKCCCGPSSGVSIGRYYREEKGYSNLPADCDVYNDCYEPMYDALYEYMDTDIFGSTSDSNYGPGFVEMALHYGYDNFSYVYDGSVTADDYGVVVDAIDNGWPVALFAMGMLQGFRGVEALPGSDDGGKWPCEVWHVIAIKGYSYYSMFGPHQYWPLTRDHRIRCTDNYSGANNLTLDWDELVDEIGGNLRMVIIKD
jgi:hypothetical protein